METIPQERRKTPRFELQLPLRIAAGEDNTGIFGITRDVSASGVYFYSDAGLASGDLVELVMTFPPEITLVKTLKIRCTTKVLRVDPAPNGVGAAVQIQSYKFIALAEA